MSELVASRPLPAPAPPNTEQSHASVPSDVSSEILYQSAEHVGQLFESFNKAWIVQRRDLKSSIRRTFRNQRVPRVTLDDLKWRASLSDIETFGIGRRRQRADWLFALDIDRVPLPEITSPLPDESPSSRNSPNVNSLGQQLCRQNVELLHSQTPAATQSPSHVTSPVAHTRMALVPSQAAQWVNSSHTTARSGRSTASLALLPALERRVQYRQLPSPAFHRAMQERRRQTIHTKRAQAAERAQRSIALVGKLRGTPLGDGAQSVNGRVAEDTSSRLSSNDLLHWTSFDEAANGLADSIERATSWAGLHHLLVRERLLQRRMEKAAVSGRGTGTAAAPVLLPQRIASRSRSWGTPNGRSDPYPTPNHSRV